MLAKHTPHAPRLPGLHRPCLGLQPCWSAARLLPVRSSALAVGHVHPGQALHERSSGALSARGCSPCRPGPNHVEVPWNRPSSGCRTGRLKFQHDVQGQSPPAASKAAHRLVPGTSRRRLAYAGQVRLEPMSSCVISSTTSQSAFAAPAHVPAHLLKKTLPPSRAVGRVSTLKNHTSRAVGRVSTKKNRTSRAVGRVST